MEGSAREHDGGERSQQWDGLLAEPVGGGRFRWQLKAQNGRLVAVSLPVHASPADAERAFADLVEAAPALVARITHVRDGLGWVWVVPGPNGAALVRSHRAYERYATCQNAFRRFVALLVKQGGRSPAGPGGRR